jgi:putative ABC transport system permease protein
MRPAWRLAIKSASGRRSRSALLVATVALSAALITAVSCAMASLDYAIRQNVVAMVGLGDGQITGASASQTISARLLDTVRSWPEVEFAAGQLQEGVTLELKRPWWGEIPKSGSAAVAAASDADAGADAGASSGPNQDTDATSTRENAAVVAAMGPFERKTRTLRAAGTMLGIVPAEEVAIRPRTLVQGRWPERAGEIALDEMYAGRLSRDSSPGSLLSQVSRVGRGKGMRETIGERPLLMPGTVENSAEVAQHNRSWDLQPGDTVSLVRLFRQPIEFRVVGIVEQPPLGGKSQAYVVREQVAEIFGIENRLSSVDYVLKNGVDDEKFVRERKGSLPRGAAMKSASERTSALEQNLAGNQIGYAVISAMAFFGASFIIMTGLSTGVTERQRELAILRSIGSTRWQIAESQIAMGVMIGVIGAVIGLPIGIAIAAMVVGNFEAEIPTGLHISPFLTAWAGVGSVLAGVIGSLIPAWMAARTSPLESLAARSKVATRGGILLASITGLVLAGTHLGVIYAPLAVDVVFWLFVLIGIPALIAGYFLLAVPVVRAVSVVVGPVIALLLMIPPSIAKGSIKGSPYRFGFTAGAMSFGLAIMVGIWTQGNAILRDWLDKLKFPEAFVVGLNIGPEGQQALRQLPFVEKTCAISLHPVETEAFGIDGVATYTSTFIGFEPQPFFEMTNLVWDEGDPASALAKLEAGGAILVAREFRAAKGLGVGDRFTCTSQDKTAEFEIAGVVHSPGLELISQFFTIGQDYTQQSVHAVFGSRKDLVESFGVDAVQMIQVGLVPEGDPRAVDDDVAVATMRKELSGAGIYDAGSARKVMKDVRSFVERTLLVSSSIAIFAMAVASLGVANIIAAGIAARRFEFGVLRSVGAGRWLVARIVLAEVLVIAIAAAILGTVCGLQGATADQRLQEIVVGLDLNVVPPWKAIAAGWALVVLVSIAAAGPSLVGLIRTRPRELLASMKG